MFNRVDIGAQVVAGDAGCSFDAKDEFSGKLFRLINPFPDGGWGKAAKPCEFRLGTGNLNRAEQCLIAGGSFNHSWRFTHGCRIWQQEKLQSKNFTKVVGSPHVQG